NGCSWQIATTINPAPEFTISAGEDVTIAFGDSLQLAAAPLDSSISYQWFGDAILDCDTCANALVKPTITSRYQLLATDENGCSATDELTVFVTKENDVFIPNAFSPDADGFNDRFIIYGGKQLVQISSLRVFDRWGTMTYHENALLPGDDTRAWDGQFQNQPMPSALYVYVAEVLFLDGRTEVLQGEVLLLR
ncbi:MAG: gliding motility-associated C-terminal domain-containing protein, partial [Bacteroidota bacterium]